MLYGKEMGCGKPGRINIWFPQPALEAPTLSGGTFLERLEIPPAIISSEGLLFLHPTGEVSICAAIAEIRDTVFPLSVSHLLIHLPPPHAQRLPLYV